MQTFLPYEDFRKSLESLDPQRLGNQVYREALTLVRGGWSSHPASKMWQGYEHALCTYALVGLDVLKERGRDYPHHRRTFLKLQRQLPNTGLPPWLGDREFHESHQSNLVSKNPDHYGPQFPDVPRNLKYVWPGSEEFEMSRREWVMLAHPYDADKDRIQGRLMSEKLDGQRAIWDGGITRGITVDKVPWANTAKDHRLVDPNYNATGLWSRYGKVIRAPGWFLDCLPPFPLDGELWAGVGSYQTMRSIVSRHDPDDRWHEVTYYSFDWPTYAELFAEGRVVSGSHYEKQFGPEIREWVRKILVTGNTGCHDLFSSGTGIAQKYEKYSKLMYEQNDHWQVLTQQQLPMQTSQAIEDMEEMMNAVLHKGGEGLILRSAHSSWKPKRTRDLLKVKPYYDDEAVVTGYTWGKKTDRGSRLLGLMGTLVVRWKDIEFELGSGFTDEERQLTEVNCGDPGQVVPDDIDNPQFPRGSVVTFKYRELSDDGVPKEATYYRKR